MKNGPAQNRHHVIFERRKAERIPEIKRLRNYGGMIILMNMQDHGKLHHDLWGSMPFPDREVAKLLTQYLPPRESMQPRDYQLNLAISFLAIHGEHATADHLREQREYIMRTPVVLDGVEYA